MFMEELPTDFDVIVVGTGMAESIVAAAVSRIGKKVLHIDTCNYYGSLWASFNLENMNDLIQASLSAKDKTTKGMFNVEHSWHIEKSIEEKVPPKEEDSETSTETQPIGDGDAIPCVEKNKIPKIPEEIKPNEALIWTQDKVMKEYRKFNIDLAPKLLYARGELVELLISSNIARYAEFRCVNRVLTWLNDSLQPVPCSRADVFATKNVTVVEKRMLMKLLTSFMEFDQQNPSDEFKGFEQKTFLEYLKSKKLTSNLIHYVLYAIAGVSDTTMCYEGVERSKRFLTSLGRYGNTPFLWSMYGCGELPQCFCRLCAVFGGVYCLNMEINSIQVNENKEDKKKSVIVKCFNKELYCEHAIVGIDKAPSNIMKNTDFALGISRAVFITNRSMLKESEREPLTLMRFPPFDGKGDPVTVIELGPCTSSCPKGLYLVHMTCAQKQTAKEDLYKFAEKVLCFDSQEYAVSSNEEEETKKETKPQVLWSLFFNMVDTSDNQTIESVSENIHLTTGPDIELDFDHAVKQGRDIFLSIYPNEDFLPRAPDPEDIVFEDEDEAVGPVFEKDEQVDSVAEEQTSETKVDNSDEEDKKTSEGAVECDSSVKKENEIAE